MTRASSWMMWLAITAMVALLALFAARVQRGDIQAALLQWWTIPAGLLVELPILWRWFDMTWRQAIMADLLMNAVSTVVGVLVVAPGLIASLYNLPLSVPSKVIVVLLLLLLFVLINTLVEYSVLQIAFGSGWTWARTGMLYAANYASVAIVVLGSNPGPFRDLIRLGRLG